MNYRTFGKTGKKVSVLGFGCMRLPILGGELGRVNLPETAKQLHYAIDQGVNYVDTAYIYHEGRGEEAVAYALQGGYRQKVHLATKLPVWNVNRYEDMETLLEQQLRNLQTDHIDFYLVHSLNRTYWSKLVGLGLFDFLIKAKEKGKLRHLGFSFHDDLEQFMQIVDAFPWEFCQIQFNYLDENYQAGLKGLAYAGSKGLGVTIMEPLRGGTLANQLVPDAKALIQAASVPLKPAQLALKWVWSHPEVGVVLSGMNEMSQVVDNLGYTQESELPLTEEERQITGQIQKIYWEKMKVNCTGCKYCMPCPSGVDIPQSFEHYNKAYMLDDIETARFWYSRIRQASQCVECGACETHCPQNIPIIETLKEVVKQFETGEPLRSPASRRS